MDAGTVNVDGARAGSVVTGVLLAVLGMVPWPHAVAQQEDLFITRPLGGGVYMLEAPDAGGNIGMLAGPDGVLLIDDRWDRDAEALRAAVTSITEEPVRFVVNTHVHPDHIGGNAALASRGVTIISHEHVRLRMLEELIIPRRGGTTFPQPPAEALPVLTYETRLRFHLNGEEVRVWRAPPAHTDGDSFVHFVHADVLHLGDVYRTNMYPIVDPFNGGSFLGMIEAMRMAIDLAGPDTVVIPGHGSGVSDRAGMEEVLHMMETLRDRVAEQIGLGRSLEQTLSAGVTDGFDARWGQVPSWNASDIIPVIYEELSGSMSP